MMLGNSFPSGFEIKPSQEQTTEIPKQQDNKSIPESSPKLGETSDLHDSGLERNEDEDKRVSDIHEPLIDDNGNEISDKDGNLKPNITYSLFGVEYRTDDNGKIYCIDGKYIENSSFTIDGHEYRTNDSGEVIKNGGSYKDVKKNSDGEISEVHHMPADSASNLDRNDGPAIKMDKEDHRQTASCGNSKDAREYQETQRELIEQGKFREALQMDIDDIHEKFGDKYDDAISELLEYVDQLEKDGKI